MPLMVSISGIRGIIGESLTPEAVIRYAGAFGEYCGKRHSPAPSVIVGRDGRSTGSFVAPLVEAVLIARGIHVREIGICPTPTVQLAVERGQRRAGSPSPQATIPCSGTASSSWLPRGCSSTGKKTASCGASRNTRETMPDGNLSAVTRGRMCGSIDTSKPSWDLTS